MAEIPGLPEILSLFTERAECIAATRAEKACTEERSHGYTEPEYRKQSGKCDKEELGRQEDDKKENSCCDEPGWGVRAGFFVPEPGEESGQDMNARSFDRAD